MKSQQLQLVPSDEDQATRSTGDWQLLVGIAAAFDPDRLTQARQLAELTKRAVSDAIGVSPAAVGQWESGVTAPRPDHVLRLAEVLDVPPGFLASGRRNVRLDVADAHFRSLRSTPASLRGKAIAFTRQVEELAYALEKRVQLPPVDLPGFCDGEVQPGSSTGDPVAAAGEVRRRWKLGDGPVAHLVRTIETHGVVTTLVAFAGEETARVDAFSTSRLPRPVIVLTPDRADDVYRHRFTAAHELGHLVLHGDVMPGDPVQEKQADAFAAEFLTPGASITPELPPRMDIRALEQLSQSWGVAVDSLVYRCHEVGRISDSAYRRAFQRINQLRRIGLFTHDPVEGFPGEVPVLLREAFRIAEQHGLTMVKLADELKVSLPRLRLLLGDTSSRPTLQLT